MNLLCNKRGQGAVETILVILFIVVPLVWTFLELGFEIYEKQVLGGYAREAANMNSRTCVGLAGANANACLDGILTTFNTAAKRSVPNFGAYGTVMGSIYRWDAVNGIAVQVSSRSVGGGGALTQYSAANIDANLLQNLGVLYIGETTLNHNKLFPIPGPLDWLGTYPQVIYETAIA